MLSVSVLLSFELQEVNGALFLRANFLLQFASFGSVTVIVPLTTIYASLKSHKSDLSVDVLNLICLLALYLYSALPITFFDNFC